jgi:hypothetical protein
VRLGTARGCRARLARSTTGADAPRERLHLFVPQPVTSVVSFPGSLVVAIGPLDFVWFALLLLSGRRLSRGSGLCRRRRDGHEDD